MPPELPRTTPRQDAHADDPDDAPEPTTGVYPATRDFVREVTRSGLFKVAVGVGGFAVACFLGGVTVSKVMAQGAKDAGVEAAAAVKKQADETDQRITRMQIEFTEHVKTESEGRMRVEEKVNALLRRFDVKDPAPTPKDAGP